MDFELNEADKLFGDEEEDINEGEYADIDIDENIVSIWDRSEITEHVSVIRIPDEDRITSNILQIEEMTEAIGIRASQIEMGSPIFCDYGVLSNPISIAKLELIQRKSPLILERCIAVRGSCCYVEHWKVSEMTYIGLNLDDINEKTVMQRKLRCVINETILI